MKLRVDIGQRADPSYGLTIGNIQWKVKFLPPTVTSLLQTIDQSVIEILKKTLQEKNVDFFRLMKKM